MWQAVDRPASCATCTAIAERSLAKFGGADGGEILSSKRVVQAYSRAAISANGEARRLDLPQLCLTEAETSPRSRDTPSVVESGRDVGPVFDFPTAQLRPYAN